MTNAATEKTSRGAAVTPPEVPLTPTEQCLDLSAAIASMRCGHSADTNGCRRKMMYRRGSMTMILFLLEPGGSIPDHSAHGLVTIHLLDGALTVTTPDQRFSMTAGQIVALASCVRHSVYAQESCAFLLTLHQERFADVGL